MKSPASRRLLLAAAILGTTSFAHAANQTWNTGGPSDNWNTTTELNWDAGVAWTQNNTAIFGGTGETVTLTAPISAAGLTFNGTGFEITGGTLTLVAPQAITVTDLSDTATISSIIAGTVGLAKSGAGTLVLTNANTYTGTTTINAGTLALSGGDNRLATAGTVNFGGTGTLDLGSTNQTLAALNSSTAATATNTVTGTGTLTVTNITVNTAVSTTATMEFGTLSDSLTVNATNMTVASAGSGAAGTPTLTANANFIGNTNATIGTVIVGLNTRNNEATTSMNAVGSLTMGSGTLTATNLIIGQDTAGGNYSKANANTQGTFTTGSGTVKVTTLTMGDKRSPIGLNTVNSIFNLSNGGRLEATTIQNGANANTHVTRTFNWNDGTITNLGATDLTISSATTGATGLNIKLAGTGTHTFDIVSGQTGTVSAQLMDLTSGGTLVKTGAGLLTLTGANTYTGLTTINDGTLQLGNGGETGSLTNGAISVAGGTLAINRSDTATVTTGGTLALNGGSIQNLGANATTMNRTSTGGTAVSFTGTNTLSAAAGGSLGITGTGTNNNSIGLNFASGTTLNSTGTVTLTGATTGTTNATRAILFGGNATLNGGSDAGDILTLKVTQPPLNGVAFYQNAAGTTVTTTGNVTFDSTPYSGNIGTSSLAFRSAGDLSYAATSGTLTLNANAPASATGDERIFALTGTFGAKLVASSGATINVTGLPIQVTAGVNNTLSGGAGALNISSDIRTFATSGTASTLTLVNAAGQSGGTIAISGVISQFAGSTLGLTQNTTGTTTLSGANTYTGGTTVSAGTLTVAATTGSIQVGNAGVTVAAGATLAVDGKLVLTAANATIANAGTIDFAASGASIFAGALFDGLGGSTYQLITNTGGTIQDAGSVFFDLTGSTVWTSAALGSDGLISFSAVPEPSTYGLLGAGALAAVAFVRRRRKLAGAVAA